MKKHVLFIALCLCLGMQYRAFASSPCSTGFALGFAIASVNFALGKEKCADAGFEGPCNEEIQTSYESSIRRIEADFSACCCIQGYSFCCG